MPPNQMLSYMNHFKRLYRQAFQEEARRSGLSQLEIDILLFLHNNPGCNTIRDISTMRGLAKSNVSNAVDTLKKRGFLTSRIDPGNRKLHRLQITVGAQDTLEALATCQKDCFAGILAGFTGEELLLLSSFFKRIDDNMQTELHRQNNREKEV